MLKVMNNLVLNVILLECVTEKAFGGN